MIVLHWAREAVAIIACAILDLIGAIITALFYVMTTLLMIMIPLWLLFWLIRFIKYAWQG